MISNLLYLRDTAFRKIYMLFDRFCQRTWDNRTSQSIVLILMSIIVVEGVDSIRSQFFHFLTKMDDKKLNAYYHTLAHSTANYKYFLVVLVTIMVSLIQDDLRSAPILLPVDDTTIEKFGKHFFGVGKLFNHSSKEKDKYVNGHCFVSACIKIPVHSGGRWNYLAIPIGYRMWIKDGEKTKLQLAEDMIRAAMEIIGSERHVIVLCDAWYGKKSIFALAVEYANLHVISNVRIDTALYNLPPAVDPHKRGPKPKKGKKIIKEAFAEGTERVRIGDFFIRMREVKVNLIGQNVWAYLSSTESEGGTSRLFISTISPWDLAMMLEGYDKLTSDLPKGRWQAYSPMILYFERWSIETCYFEHKGFWSLEEYMVRSGQGINMLLNLICVAYSAMKLLPYLDSEYAEYKNESPQVIRLAVSERLQEDIILGSLVDKLAGGVNYEQFSVVEKEVIKACQRYCA